MSLYGYDFSDHLIRDMVRENHVPYEGVVTTVEGTTLRPVLCDKCQVEWPCAQISAYREWEATRHDSMKDATTEAPMDQPVLEARG